MTLVNPAWSVRRRLPDHVEIALRPDEARFGHAARDARVPATGHRFMQIDELDLVFLDRLARSAALSIEAGGQTLISLPLPNAEGAVQALRMCNDNLLSQWGVDVALWNSLRTRPEPIAELVTIFTPGDYPSAAFHRGVSGALVIRYTVDVDGRVSACAVAESSGHASLDEGTCRLMLSRGRFRPAIGADGEPVATQMVIPVRWEMQ
ncbi:MAG: energy transducer TonB [Sphingomonas sp.]|nr:energy transducer TonB [Sphingomonas sp.]